MVCINPNWLEEHLQSPCNGCKWRGEHCVYPDEIPCCTCNRVSCPNVKGLTDNYENIIEKEKIK